MNKLEDMVANKVSMSGLVTKTILVVSQAPW